MFGQLMYRIMEVHSIGETDKDYLVDGCLELSKDEIIEKLKKHKTLKRKDKREIFIPAAFKPEEDWELSPDSFGGRPTYRNDANIEAISLVVLDLDQEGELEVAEDVFQGLEYFVYSTHSYTKEKPYKFRMVLFPDKEIPVEKWPVFFQYLIAGVNADRTCGNPSRVYYYPTISPDAGLPAFYKHVPGRLITEQDFLALGERFLGDKMHNVSRWSGKTRVRVEERRHPSGGVETSAQYKAFLPGIDDTLEEMEKRHEREVAKLIATSHRHAFALSVIKHDLEVFGFTVNWDAVIKFIFYCAGKYSNKPLWQGNTANELSGMIVTGYFKYAPDQLNVDDKERVAELKQLIRCSVENADKLSRMVSPPWGFPERKSAQSIEERVCGNCSSINSLKVKYAADFVRAFSNSEWLALLNRLCKLEYIRSKDSFKLIDLFELTLSIKKDYLAFKEVQDPEKMFTEFVQNFAKKIQSEEFKPPKGMNLSVDNIVNQLRHAFVAVKKG